MVYKVVLSDSTELKLVNNENNREKIGSYFLRNQIQRIHSSDTTLQSVFIKLTGKGLE